MPVAGSCPQEILSTGLTNGAVKFYKFNVINVIVDCQSRGLLQGYIYYCFVICYEKTPFLALIFRHTITLEYVIYLPINEKLV